ncbi:methylmalonyl Co-A mutase-associated GTPase MeaB [Janibacter alkaliphilus]|uniref:LAO/AO transport system kinase n=1 Tax=Janibacter alkaliphilus TaxID=1069963 RepID=A0A852X2W5_9MICO|nr:methylmalonyl Co-A mutase-associated GTPase MeaB [Janibacter alkaliphilus]NYG37219.1 LAO/AO transport system kinase [Janibacter alkaliphilus]
MPEAVADLAAGVRSGSRAHVARAITLVESSRPDHRERAGRLLAELAGDTGGSVRVGISGIPGAGKSTFIDALGTRLIEQGHRVAVVAVDPSSSRTGGSVLGDRTRMAALTASDDAFVRPSPSGAHLGGVARATRESMLVLEAAGFDVVLVETVGVGQSEVAVAGMVDTFLLLALARGGDQLQGIKRGILEMADVIAVNKADGPHESDAWVAARELSGAMRLMNPDPEARRPPVLTCSAQTGTGLDEVWQAVLDHRSWLEQEGSLHSRRAEQQRDWMWAMVDAELRDRVRRAPSVRAELDGLVAGVRSGETSAVEAAQRILVDFAGDLHADLRQDPTGP